jgi:hypothetical protein
MLTVNSRWYLLGPQVEGASYDSRVWRLIHSFGSVEQGIGRRIEAITRNECLQLYQAAVEVEPIEPKDPALIATIKSMDERGIKMLYGRWLVDGAPRVLLFDTGTGYRWLDEWKADLWASTGIPSPPGDSETNEAIVFGYLIAWFLGEVRKGLWNYLHMR